MKTKKIFKTIILSVFLLVLTAFVGYSCYEGIANGRGPITAIGSYISANDPISPKPGVDTDIPSKPNDPTEELPSLSGMLFSAEELSSDEFVGIYFKDDKTAYCGYLRLQNETLFLLQVNDENVDNLTYNFKNGFVEYTQDSIDYSFKFDAENETLTYFENGEDSGMIFSKISGFTKVVNAPNAPTITIEDNTLTVSNVEEDCLITLNFDCPEANNAGYPLCSQTVYELTQLSLLEAGRTYTVYAFSSKLIDGEYVKSISSNILTYTLPKEEISLSGKFFAYANDENGYDIGRIESDGFLHITGVYFANESTAVHGEFKKIDDSGTLILLPANLIELTYTLENNVLNMSDIDSGELLLENGQVFESQIVFDGDSLWRYYDWADVSFELID